MAVASFPVAVGIVLSIVLWQPHAVASCGEAPRTIGAFGAENKPAAPVPMPAAIRSQLPDLVAVRQVLTTRLSPSGEQVIIYDAAIDESDPHPKVAFVVGGKVAKVLDETQTASGRGGFVRYLSGCPFDAAAHRKALALAFSTAFDGSGSAFAIIMWQSGEYGVVFNPHGMQAQLVLRRGSVELWTSDGTGECVWCAQHYQLTQYVWRDGKYVRTATNKAKHTYDPALISGTALRVKAPE